jgi:hypothetical protein
MPQTELARIVAAVAFFLLVALLVRRRSRHK